MSDDSKREEEGKLPANLRTPTRRQFIGWTSLIAGWAALPGQRTPLSLGSMLSESPEQLNEGATKITLLEDGGFKAGGLGWQMGQGCQLISMEKAPSPQALHVQCRGTSSARALILGPVPGKTYTVHGFMRTNAVRPLEPGGCAVMSLDQLWYQAWFAEKKKFASLTGSHDWAPFSFTLECKMAEWFELSLGLYRAEGEAWFANLTLVEGTTASEISEVVSREEERGFPSPVRSAKANVAIFRDNVPVRGTASNPESLGSLLQSAGYQVEYLSAERLSDPGQFSRDRYDILVLPYGASFPALAQKALVSFLRRGGSFFSTGGYAFNNPLLKTSRGWLSESEALAEEKGTELIREGSFEGSLDDCKSAGWKILRPECCSLDSAQVHEGRQSAKVAVSENEWWKEAIWEYEVGDVHDRDRFVFSCWTKTQDVSDRFDGYAYVYLEQLDASHTPVEWVKPEVVRLRGTTDWAKCERETVTCEEPANMFVRPIKWVRVRFGLWKASGTLWVDQVSLRKKSVQIRINTAKGNPLGDSLHVSPDQIGTFDADYRLQRVSYLAVAPGQHVLQTPLHINVEATGPAACGLQGPDFARWTPLLNAYDSYGRLRGAAGALMRHYNGFYRKSHWAFFGIENRDLFAADDPSTRSLLLETFEPLHQKLFLHEVQTNYACYRQGESVHVWTRVSNFSSLKQNAVVAIRISTDPQKDSVFHHSRELSLEPDQTLLVTTTWSPDKFQSPRYAVEVELEQSERKIDRVESGFVVWDESVLKNGFQLHYRDNYLRYKDRAIFLQGSDDYIHNFIARYENPKTWFANVSKYRDNCLGVYENLMGSRGLDDVPPEEWWRQIDAMMQICQECKTIFFPGLLIFGDTAVGNRDLKHQQEFCRTFAERYKIASGLIYYLDGDLALRQPNLPDLRKIFNDYLLERYGNAKRLAEAWSISPAKAPLGAIPPLGGTERWEDARTFDNFIFRVNVVRRWLDAMAAAVRESDSKHPISAEFYQRPWDGVDVVTGVGSLDIGSIGYFDRPGEDVYGFPQTFRFIDTRARGKSINDGEFGVRTHPAWEDAGGYDTTRSATEEQQLFLTLPHYAVGLGISKMHNWCWAYPQDLVTGWGINYMWDLVGRDSLSVYRNTGLFFRQFDLKYDSPEVFFLIADNHRMGGQGEKVRESQLNGIRFLLDLHCNFATIDEHHLQDIPASCKVLVYPLPFCPDDATFERVLAFVQAGGILYVSGDVSYDSERKRTRLERLPSLLGVEFVAENYPNIKFPSHEADIRVRGGFSGLKDYRGFPCIRVRPVSAEVVAATPTGEAVITTNNVGKGRVFYSTDVLELHAPARTTDFGRMVYLGLLRWAGVSRPVLNPDKPNIHYFRSTTRQGDELFTIVNRDEAVPKQEISFETKAGTIRLDVDRRMTGAIALTAKGAVQSLETSGKVSAQNEVYCRAENHVMLFSLDGSDIRDSEALCLLPIGEGVTRIRSRSMANGGQFEVGEFRDGKWTSLENQQLGVNNGWLELKVTRDRNLSIILLALAASMARAREQLTRVFQFEPQSV